MGDCPKLCHQTIPLRRTLPRAPTGPASISPRSPSWAIYEAIAEGLGLDPQEDEIPVRDQINPEALASLFRDDGGEAAVSFPIRGACVTGRSDGLVEIVQE